MIQFSKLRIHGFKSFVDRTELEIAPGLNGIVGPNGCGKSNLVEALKWVMGESSAKRMRGSGMEDVIFNGTEKRAKRSIAEVSILLDNQTRSAPAQFNSSDEIDVTRKIERDRGSIYRINGRATRARDVQMLFADTVTGANSPSMVSQGHVTKMINAKPHERRLILEESAGISGLYARRHEAELRLKAADTNMLRIEDVLGSMEARLSQLKRQARQASRYRNINAQIRQMEVLISWLEWQSLDERAKATHKTFDEAETIVANKLSVVTQLTKTQTTQGQDLPSLRQKEAEAAAALQALKVELARLDDETARHEQNIQELTSQHQQTSTDFQHEKILSEETASTLESLEKEQKIIITNQENEGDDLKEKQKIKDKLEEQVINLEERYTTLMQSAAESRARQQALEQQIEQNQQRMETIKTRKSKAEEDLSAQSFNQEEIERLRALKKESDEIETYLEQKSKNEDTLQKTILYTKEQIETARGELQIARANSARFTAEIDMLENLFETENEQSFSPVLDNIQAEQGFEKALSRALGDTLLASLDDDAPTRWLKSVAMSHLPDLPKGVQRLGPHIKAPVELTHALSQIGFVNDDADVSKDILKDLSPGQSIVSKNGSYWRWDGFYVSAEATDRHAQHLEQKNKFLELQNRWPEIEAVVESAQKILESKVEELDAAENSYQEYRQDIQTQTRILSEKRAALSHLREEHMRYESEVAHLKDTIEVAGEDLGTLQDVIKWDKERLSSHTSKAQEQQDEDTEELKELLNKTRTSYQGSIREFDAYQQEQRSRQARLQALADERVALQNRLIRARERVKDLSQRQERLSRKLELAKAKPEDSQEIREDLLGKASSMEAIRNQASEDLAICEGAISETNKALKEAESIMSEARENRAHAQATMAIIKEQQDSMLQDIQQKFSMQPQELKTHSAMDLDKSMDDLDNFKNQKERLIREREAIGAVNLRAEQEADELEIEVTTLLNERNDLMQAIDELRQGISKINAEARDRLNAAFAHVNAHFSGLFKRLFAGGEAHLALIDSDDPLDAGLEIFAQPPGKSLQALSLLSGGEQTLASIALIFAMFMTNPSPICVLDEIDAPLDDSNVDRVCDLLEEIAERGETRFLVITHHRLTMARMDRLYGVTMSEQGISQLVSVDLQQSFDFLEEAA